MFMRRFLLPSLILLFAFSIQAQSSRISVLAKQLQQNINILADASANEFFNRSTNSRDQIDNFLVLQQAKFTAEILLLLVNNNRPNPELRETADSLNEHFSRYNPDSSNRPQKQQIEKDIDELINELKRDGKPSDDKPDKNNATLGRLNWQGTVDDEVHLTIRGNIVQVKTISGTEYNDALFNFSSPLPNENVQVFVNKKDGRGTAKVIQQPTADNNFTAIVQIQDKNGGAREYDLEIYWTK
jgi:hypothetical protein